MGAVPRARRQAGRDGRAITQPQAGAPGAASIETVLSDFESYQEAMVTGRER
jgi:hypothetical protein